MVESKPVHIRLQSSYGRFYAAIGLPLAVVMALSGLVAALLVSGFVQVGWPVWVWLGGGVAIGAFVGTAIGAALGQARAWVELTGSVLNMPGPRFFARVVVPVAELDVVRSSNRSGFQRLVGEQKLWLRNGARVTLNHRWFKRGELQALLHEAGCA